MQTLLNVDCIDGMTSLEDNSIDVVVTSPPYNIGVEYNSYSDNLSNNQYMSFMNDVAVSMFRLLKTDGSIFLNVGSTNKNPWIVFDIANIFRKYFILQNTIIWVKSLSIGEDSIGHFKPISSKRYLNNNHETIFHFTKSGDVPIDRLSIGVPFKDKSNIKRFGHDRDKRCAGNVWFIPYDTVKSKEQKFNHPATFPIELVRRCLKMHGGPNLAVLDPFVGSGTTLVACQELGHSGIGFDVDQKYIDVAKSRLGKSTNT